jgi:septum formation protein
VLAADTVVVVDGDILGKPMDAETARTMLHRLAGRRHEVFTGVALTADHSADPIGGIERSEVAMAPLSEQEIRWYVDTGEPLDKAGAYAIQGLGALFVDAVFGNYSNVVGLPLTLTQKLFRDLGYDLLQFRDQR